MKIIISPYSRRLRNGNENPKNYPFWDNVTQKLAGHEIVQVGVVGELGLVTDFRPNLRLDELRELLKWCDTWASVDNFFQHLAWSVGKPGVVIWGQSDPEIFGHRENVNLLKGREFLRANQFDIWETAKMNVKAFVSSDVVVSAILGFNHDKQIHHEG